MCKRVCDGSHGMCPTWREAREAASRAIKDVVWASEIINRIGRHFKKGTLQREPIEVNDSYPGDGRAIRHRDDSDTRLLFKPTLAEDLPQVIADQVELQQVLMNLMLNGMESMKELENPGTLRIVTQHAEDGFVMISVTDTGKGIEPEQAEHIFDAFFTTKKEGTGMGLAISRSIIESHGGRLWFTPNTGPGATFYFTLPIDASVKEQTNCDAPAESAGVFAPPKRRCQSSSHDGAPIDMVRRQLSLAISPDGAFQACNSSAPSASTAGVMPNALSITPAAKSRPRVCAITFCR